MFVNVNKLKPYQFLDEKTLTIDWFEPMYWEGQKYIEMDDKNEDHHDKLIFVVHVVPINEKSMP